MPDHAPARWTLSDHPDLGQLRRQRAKELRHRAATGDGIEPCSMYDPGEGRVTLTRAQRVLARAYGFPGWSRLREHADTHARLTRNMYPTEDSDDDRFLRLACLSYTEP